MKFMVDWKDISLNLAYWLFGQRTELYEYSKLLGNAQFTLLPFQPYKLVYAHMLAEVGKVSESLKYTYNTFHLHFSTNSFY